MGLSDIVSDDAVPGGYNGGGSGSIGLEKLTTASGGGATDLRFLGDEFRDRIIIAGGGGGASMTNAYNNICGHGGHGGGETAGNSAGYSSQADSDTVFGASQNYPGYSKAVVCPTDKGKLGRGGDGLFGCFNSSSGGGGGGLFGGGGGSATGGSGGSAYVSALASNVSMIPGSLYMPSPYHGSEYGHIGNGNIRITYLSEAFFQVYRITCNYRSTDIWLPYEFFDIFLSW